MAGRSAGPRKGGVENIEWSWKAAIFALSPPQPWQAAASPPADGGRNVCAKDEDGDGDSDVSRVLQSVL